MGGIRGAWKWAWSRSLRLLGDAHRHFGNLYDNEQEYWSAVENYTRAASLDPSYAEPFYCRGVLYWRELNNPSRAIEDLSRALELEPTRALAYFNRGLAYKLQREFKKAIDDFEQYLVEGSDEYWLESAERQLAELHDIVERTQPGPDTSAAKTRGEGT